MLPDKRETLVWLEQTGLPVSPDLTAKRVIPAGTGLMDDLEWTDQRVTLDAPALQEPLEIAEREDVTGARETEVLPEPPDDWAPPA